MVRRPTFLYGRITFQGRVVVALGQLGVCSRASREALASWHSCPILVAVSQVRALTPRSSRAMIAQRLLGYRHQSCSIDFREFLSAG
jgi:hypothetical protein